MIKIIKKLFQISIKFMLYVSIIGTLTCLAIAYCNYSDSIVWVVRPFELSSFEGSSLSWSFYFFISSILFSTIRYLSQYDVYNNASTVSQSGAWSILFRYVFNLNREVLMNLRDGKDHVVSSPFFDGFRRWDETDMTSVIVGVLRERGWLKQDAPAVADSLILECYNEHGILSRDLAISKATAIPLPEVIVSDVVPAVVAASGYSDTVAYIALGVTICAVIAAALYLIVLEGRISSLSAVSAQVNNKTTDLSALGAQVNQINTDLSALGAQVNHINTDLSALGAHANKITDLSVFTFSCYVREKKFIDAARFQALMRGLGLGGEPGSAEYSHNDSYARVVNAIASSSVVGLPDSVKHTRIADKAKELLHLLD